MQQPGRLGALTRCFLVNVAFGILVIVPISPAQDVSGTPQQANDRIRALSASVRFAPHDYVIGNGDLLEIEVFDVKELSRQVRVSQTGSIGIPLVPVRLHITGLTEIQAEQKIAEVLEANGLVSHPQVSVSVKERKSKPITVVGAVLHPMVYQADHSVTLLEVLAEAGGINNDAGDTVIVTRAVPEQPNDSVDAPAIGPEDSNASESAVQKDPASNAMAGSAAPGAASANQEPPPLANTITVNLNQLVETGDTTHNILLQAGDIVTVPHSGIVYVLGSVGKPGGFVLANDRSHMTALKILALAGGLTPSAKSDHAVIIRRDSQGMQHEVTVDLKKVQKRQIEDVMLMPSDILYVPDSGSKKAILRAAEIGIGIGSAITLYRLAYR